MSEVLTPPIEAMDGTVSFPPGYSLADIARWIMQNRGEAEDLHMLLGQMLSETSGGVMQ